MARSRRVRAAAIAAAAALVAATAAGCGNTVPMGASTQSPTTSVSASTPAAILTAEHNAEAQLQDWVWNPQGGMMTYNTIQVTSGNVNVMTILTGSFDPSGTAALTGSIETLGSGSTVTGTASAIETDSLVYTTIPTALQTADRADKQWESSRVDATWEGDAEHSGWWQLLYQTRDLKAQGATGLGGTSVDVFTEVLDLSKLSDIPKSLLDSEALRKAGTTKVEVDVYTVSGSGKLARVTYKLGLPVAIDASATTLSTAGYEVDLSGLEDATATPSATPAPSASTPDPTTVASGTGDQDLAALLPF